MISKTAKRILDNTPKDVDVFVGWYAELTVLVNGILRDKGITVDNCNPESMPETYSYLHNGFNLSLHSLAKLQTELGESLLSVSKKAI